MGVVERDVRAYAVTGVRVREVADAGPGSWPVVPGCRDGLADLTGDGEWGACTPEPDGCDAFAWDQACGQDAERFDIDDPHDLGRLGEEIAARFLEATGARVLARNWRCPAGEADIVAREEGDDVLVEVKTRLGDDADPLEGIDGRKRLRYREIGLWYLMRHPEAPSIRFDAVAVNVGESGHARVRRVMGVFAWDS